jgi:hypothetical protein
MTTRDGFDPSVQLPSSQIRQSCITPRLRQGALALTVMPSVVCRESWRVTLAALYRPAVRWSRSYSGLWGAS